MVNFVHISLILLGYLLGSIPSSYLVAKSKGVDLKKKIQNGRFGATHVSRECGSLAGFIVGVMDLSKGIISVMIADIISGKEVIVLATGLAAIVGHNWSVFMRFIGGKGAAVTFGNLLFVLTNYFLIAVFLTAISFTVLANKENIFRIKKSSFLTGILYIFTFVFALTMGNRIGLMAFSPIIFSVPMMLKSND